MRKVNRKNTKEKLNFLYDNTNPLLCKDILKEIDCPMEKDIYHLEELSKCLRETITRKVKETSSQENLLEKVKRILDKISSRENLLAFYKIIKKNEEREKLLETINSFSGTSENLLNLILSYYYKLEKVFGKYSDSIVKYIAKYSDRNILYKIIDIKHEEKIVKEIEKINLESLGKRQIDRLVKLVYMLDILYDDSIEVYLDPNKNLYDNYLSIKNVVEKRLEEKLSNKLRKFLDQNENKIDIILSWLKYYPEILKKSIQNNLEKFGSEKTYLIEDYEISLNPRDLISQMLSLQLYQSCISPGREFFEYSKIYLENPYTFFGIIKKNKKIVGRFLVFIGYNKNRELSISKISKVYSNKNYEIGDNYELKKLSLERVAEDALEMYAKDNNLKYLEEGKICVPSLIDAYGDYIILKEHVKKNQENLLCVYVFGKDFI